MFLYNNVVMRLETFEADSEEPVLIQVASYDIPHGRQWLPVLISSEMQTPLLVRFRDATYYSKLYMHIYTKSRAPPRSVTVVLVLLSTTQMQQTVFVEKFCTSLTTGKS